MLLLCLGLNTAVRISHIIRVQKSVITVLLLLSYFAYPRHIYSTFCPINFIHWLNCLTVANIANRANPEYLKQLLCCCCSVKILKRQRVSSDKV